MLKKHPLTLSDRARWQSALSPENRRNSSTSFSSVFLWHRHCPLLLAEYGERMSLELRCRLRGRFFLFPIGSGELRPALEAMMADAGSGFTLRYLEENQCRELEALFPDTFLFEEDRDNADYLYSLEAFATLAGKKLHGKRNFCNRFEAAHSWEARPLQRADFPLCLALFDRWAQGREDSEDERTALSAAFTQWEALELEGTLLFAEGELIAFSVAEQLSADTAVIHFEKAESSVPGAYPMIARETARQLRREHPALLTLNREEDMGIPGLRKAKEEWYPSGLLMKYTVRLK